MDEYDPIINDTCVIYFTAKWCGPCKKVKPLLKDLMNEHNSGKSENDIIKLVTVDIDEHEDTANEYSVSAIPKLVFKKENEIIQEVVGVKEDEIRNGFKKMIENQIVLPKCKEAELEKW